MNFKILVKLMKFKVVVLFFCSICLIYQTYLIIEQYLKFNSIINIKFTKNIINSLPAITICYNELYSFERLTKRYNEEEVYENYTQFLKKAYELRYDKNSRDYITNGNTQYSTRYILLKG